jgi:prevent-host-death family protein
MLLTQSSTLTIIFDYGLIIERSKLMREIAISEFKAKCLSLLEQVQKTKQPLRITRFGKPVAEVVPPSPQAGRADWLGSMKGTMKIVGDIVSPANDESDWEVLRD